MRRSFFKSLSNIILYLKLLKYVHSDVHKIGFCVHFDDHKIYKHVHPDVYN